MKLMQTRKFEKKRITLYRRHEFLFPFAILTCLLAVWTVKRFATLRKIRTILDIRIITYHACAPIQVRESCRRSATFYYVTYFIYFITYLLCCVALQFLRGITGNFLTRWSDINVNIAWDLAVLNILYKHRDIFLALNRTIFALITGDF